METWLPHNRHEAPDDSPSRQGLTGILGTGFPAGILKTFYAMTGDWKILLGVHMGDFVAKPVDMDKLMTAVGSAWQKAVGRESIDAW